MSTLVAQTISNGSVSTSSANVIQGSAKAWCNYNGSTATILSFYNVSSVTVLGTGIYRYNFTNAFANANYAVSLGWPRDSGSGAWTVVTMLDNNNPQTTTNVTVTSGAGSTALTLPRVSVVCLL